MSVPAIASVQMPAASEGSAAAASDQATIFNAMMKGMLTGGMSLMNSIVGDTMAAIADPSGDPDQ